MRNKRCNKFRRSSSERIKKIFAESLQLFKRKNHDYGESWEGLGLKGIFCGIYSKSSRLKQLIWKGENRNVKEETVRDTLRDLLVYAGMGIMALEDKNFDGLKETKRRRIKGNFKEEVK